MVMHPLWDAPVTTLWRSSIDDGGFVLFHSVIYIPSHRLWDRDTSRLASYQRESAASLNPEDLWGPYRDIKFCVCLLILRL
ncbi:hypothetical protein PILCRDRAFT_179344 [Piloderma croceum F 1598]|uniref:Uncharacterized protein n=1 Tax=Piloderma croceum (strain F 1598) TaxID=765440 RepID=A0A0C3G1V8_PILCF|nr:hypothetical protein PILCRDRAFT_179344 [Piloderma croceum F 1598]